MGVGGSAGDLPLGAVAKMPTKEIPAAQWREFLDGFSRVHDGWLVTLEILGELGAQIEANQLPLRGITADRDGDRTEITILLGDAERRVTHRVTGASTSAWIRPMRARTWLFKSSRKPVRRRFSGSVP